MGEEGVSEGTAAAAAEVTTGIGIEGAKGLGRGTRRTGSTITTRSGRGDSMTHSGIDGCESVVSEGGEPDGTRMEMEGGVAWKGGIRNGMLYECLRIPT